MQSEKTFSLIFFVKDGELILTKFSPPEEESVDYSKLIKDLKDYDDTTTY